MILGAVLLTWGSWREIRNLRILGVALTIVSSLLLTANAIGIDQSSSIQSRALILLNDNERGNLRYAAAQTLARIGRRTSGAEKSSGFLQGRIFQGPYQSDCRGYDAVHALTVRNTRSLLVPKPLDPSSPGLPRLRTWSAESSAAPHPDLSTYAQHHTAR